MNAENEFTRMQKAFYVGEARRWTPNDRDPVVGSFDAHNAHADYDLLFSGLDTRGKLALDFGCGPGRMMVRYAGTFARIDGADIALENLVHAWTWCALHMARSPTLYKSSGVDLAEVPSAAYDVVFSTICLQHIPVHEIRLNLFREFFRVLKPGGWFTAQMGYGDDGDERGVDYHANRYDATLTNGMCDVKVTDPSDVFGDLYVCGFRDFSFVVRPVGPNDWHPNWIFFHAQKPGVRT